MDYPWNKYTYQIYSIRNFIRVNSVNSRPINTIILLTKIYIFAKSRSSLELMIEKIKQKVKHVYEEQRQVLQLNLEQEKFDKEWKLLTNICWYSFAVKKGSRVSLLLTVSYCQNGRI